MGLTAVESSGTRRVPKGLLFRLTSHLKKTLWLTSIRHIKCHTRLPRSALHPRLPLTLPTTGIFGHSARLSKSWRKRNEYLDCRFLNSNLNAGAIVTVTDDARNPFTFNSATVGSETWKAGGIAGTPKASTLAVDVAPPVSAGRPCMSLKTYMAAPASANRSQSREMWTLLKDSAVGSDAIARNGVVLGATISSEAEQDGFRLILIRIQAHRLIRSPWKSPLRHTRTTALIRHGETRLISRHPIPRIS